MLGSAHHLDIAIGGIMPFVLFALIFVLALIIHGARIARRDF